jgi:hypothetical protein
VGWYIPVIPAVRKLQQEDCKFKPSFNYIVRPFLRKQTNKIIAQALGIEYINTQKSLRNILGI